MVALADGIVRGRLAAFVPAGVVAQTWRGTARQQAVARLLKADGVRTDPLDAQTALAVGTRLGAAGTADVVDGHVAILAARVRGVVYTSDPDDIRALDPSLQIVKV